jgi:hypothetical protein
LPTPYDPLFELQLRIARRADEFAQLCAKAGSATRDREMWQQAEAECLRRFDLCATPEQRPSAVAA